MAPAITRAVLPSRNSLMYFMARLPSPFTELGEQRQRLLGLLRVELLDGVADVEDDVVADGDAVDQRQRDLLAHAADVDHRLVAFAQFDTPLPEWRGTLVFLSNAGQTAKVPSFPRKRGPIGANGKALDSRFRGNDEGRGPSVMFMALNSLRPRPGRG
jgi:hypothetical protein